MGRADGGGADGGATAAELGADTGCMPGSRARRCFVVGGLPRVAGRIGPSRVVPTPQDKPTTNQSETSLVSDTPWTKETEEGLKSSSLRAIRVAKRGGHTHPSNTQVLAKKYLVLYVQNDFFDLPRAVTFLFLTFFYKTLR